jgi:hypothetical protein
MNPTTTPLFGDVLATVLALVPIAATSKITLKTKNLALNKRNIWLMK